MRTFVGILVAFALLVGTLVAYLTWQGQGAREYGREAARAAVGRSLPAAGVDCAALLKREPPATVQRCVVRLENGQPTATLTLEGGRVARISP